MPNLDELLEDSMLFVAARGGEQVPVEIPVDGDAFSFAPPDKPPKQISDTAAENLPIWHWKLSASDPTGIEQLSCSTRGMGGCRMVVCEGISFEHGAGVTVTTRDQQRVRLRLSKEFLVRRFALESGRIAGLAHRMYPLAANVDRSLLSVFAYDFAGGPTKPPRKPAPAVLANASFMPRADALLLGPTLVRPGQTATAIVDRFRVVVFVQLVCCKERADFDPGGALGAGRFYANVMVMANRPLEQVRAGVRHARPRKSTMVTPDGGTMDMHMTDMNDAIGTVLFADRNDKFLPGPPLPTWDNMFDYYDLAPKAGAFVAVDPSHYGGREIHGAIEELENKIATIGPKDYAARSVRKVPRQAAFDNLHCAPTMKVPGLSDETKYQGAPYFLDKIVMAPFCVHDCMHIHWRWGEFSTVQQALGWSGGVPFSKSGAPMVPENQTVKVEILSPWAFDYVAEANARDGAIDPGAWTYVNHHGASYALAERDLAADARKAVAVLVETAQLEPEIGETSKQWSVFYWHLRFGGAKAIPMVGRTAVVQERLRIDDLANARDG